MAILGGFAATLAAVPAPADEPDPSMARIVTGQSRPSDCVSAIAVTRVDGAVRALSHKAFNLEPGQHSLAGRVLLDTRFCAVPEGAQPYQVPPLEAQFEAGRTYYVGFDHSATDMGEWQYVIWQVE